MLGGIIGGAIDVASGSHKRIKEKEVYFDFEKERIAAEPGYRTFAKATAQKTPQPIQKAPQPKPKARPQPKRKAPPQLHITTARPTTFAMPDIDIKCIVFSAGRPAVLIGGNEIIHEGGTIAGATVTRIMVKKNTVEFEMNRRIWQHRVNK